MVAKQNRASFRQKLDEKLIPLNRRQFITEMEGDEPFIDEFGRATFFTVKLSDCVLPVYQTGTVMFESAVKGGSTSAVYHGGSQ